MVWSSESTLVSILDDQTSLPYSGATQTITVHPRDARLKREESCHPNFVAEDIESWTCPIHVTSMGPVKTNSNSYVPELPPEIWVVILTWCEHPGQLVISSRMLFGLSQMARTKALFLVKRYGITGCIHGSINWKFMTACRQNRKVKKSKRAVARKCRITSTGIDERLLGKDFLKPCVWCVRRDKIKRDRKSTICGRSWNALSRRLSKLLRILLSLSEPEIIKCPFERMQIDLVDTIVALRLSNLNQRPKNYIRLVQTHADYDLDWAPYDGEEANEAPDSLPILFAAMKGHLNLLTLLIDIKVGNMPSSHMQSMPRWMINGELLFNAVRKKNLKLIELLCARGAATPNAGGTKAYEFAMRKGYADIVRVMQMGGGVVTEASFRVVLKKAMVRKMFFLLYERENNRWIRILESAMMSLEGTDDDFITMADDYLTNSMIELGSVRLLKVCHARGVNLDTNEGAPLFYAIIMGNNRVARYLIREVRVPILQLFKIRRVMAIVFLLLLNAVVLGWCIANFFTLAIAVVCWAQASGGAVRVAASGWCASQTGYNIIDLEYWLKTSALMIVLILTMVMAQKTMPIHGMILAFKEALIALHEHRQHTQQHN